MSILTTKTFKRATNFASAFVIAVSGLAAFGPFLNNAGATPNPGVYVVSGNTAAAENSDGWLFNRDPSTATPYEFNADESVFGDGSLYVKPIGSNPSDKFVAENFVLTDMDEVQDISFDYQLGPNSVNSDYDQIYMNVYANFASSGPNKFYDCRYTVLATTGSTSSFNTLTFDPSNAYSVATRGTSPHICPAVPSAMDLLEANSTIRAFAINVGDTTTGDTGVDAYLDWVVVNLTGARHTTYDFEPIIPACSADDTTFDTFSNGSVNDQKGWSSTGNFDQEIVTNDYGINSFGCKSLRLSNSVTSGSFGDQTFSYAVANEAGETDSTSNGQSGGTRQTHFEAQFDIASTQSDKQNGLALSVSPDRGDGSRMSYLRFVDGTNGIEMYFDDVQNGDFVETYIGILSDRTAPHTIKFVMDFVDGPSNDVVEIWVDGVLKHTGTSWEDYYRFDPESAAEQSPRAIDSLLFRAGGTAAPATDGNGFLFDNVNIATSVPLVNEEPEEPPVDNGGNNEGNGGSENNNDDEDNNGPASFITPIITNPGSVLGNETNGGDTDTAGVTDDKTNTEQQKGFDGTIAGIAWYWWLLVLAVLGAGSWWLVGWLRRRNDETSASK